MLRTYVCVLMLSSDRSWQSKMKIEGNFKCLIDFSHDIDKRENIVCLRSLPRPNVLLRLPLATSARGVNEWKRELEGERASGRKWHAKGMVASLAAASYRFRGAIVEIYDVYLMLRRAILPHSSDDNLKVIN